MAGDFRRGQFQTPAKKFLANIRRPPVETVKKKELVLSDVLEVIFRSPFTFLGTVALFWMFIEGVDSWIKRRNRS